jgi:hypothetical protein
MTPSPLTDQPLESTFEWREPRMRQRLRLLCFFLVAVVIHAGCFYVFQVVYPSSTRGIPVPMRLMVLSPNDPAAQDVLQEVEDRVVGYGLSPGDRAVTVSLENNYQPSFAGYRPKLRDLPQGSITRMPLPGAFDGDVLPPATSTAGGERRESVPGPHEPTEPLVVFGGALSDRIVTLLPKLGKLFAKNHGTLATFTVGVNRAGVVEYCLPEEEFRADDLDALQSALIQFRFEPRSEGGIVWGTAIVEW